MSTPNSTDGRDFFPEAVNPHFENCNFVSGNVGSITSQGTNFDPWAGFYDAVAPNAILNAGGRADEVRCYPGTRQQVISRAESWMESGYLQDRRIFWLSGPAGAGKSAIVQTLAENCISRGTPMANFFFFRTDASRAYSRPVVATLLYQIFEFIPELKPVIDAIIRQDRLVFQKPLREQLTKLLDGPIRSIRRGVPTQTPIVILIDGLDECDPRPALDNWTTAQQIALLNALNELVTSQDSAFIALVASRVESHIEMVFNAIGRARRSIYLNGDYRPDQDIRRYVSAELARIKRTHPLGQHLDASWPLDASVTLIVQKSSGQFIYAATAVRFIANSPESPAFTTDLVLSIQPTTNHSPFAEIDAVYTFILSRSRHWRCASEIIVVARFNQGAMDFGQLGYSENDARSFFGDLKSLIEVIIERGAINPRFYHASFTDFIHNPNRAGRFYIDLNNSANTLAPRLILGTSTMERFNTVRSVFSMNVHQISPPLTHALTHLPFNQDIVPWDNIKAFFLPRVEELYSTHHGVLYRQILDHVKARYNLPEHVSIQDEMRPFSMIHIQQPLSD